MRNKWVAIKAIIFAESFMVITNPLDIARIQPEMSERFRRKLQDHIDGLLLAEKAHERMIAEWEAEHGTATDTEN